MVQVIDAMRATMDLVSYRGIIYEARDYLTNEALPNPERAIWVPLLDDEIIDLTVGMGLLFSSPGEFANFKFMLRQVTTRAKTAEPYVIIRYGDGLAYMTDYGLQQVEKPGFTPNFINHQVISEDDPDYPLVKDLFETIAKWVGGEAQAHSLLYHLATALQPSWAPVKYILLLGSGRNGKGLLLAMFRKLLGERNVSGVQRQAIAAQRPILASLNGKLANIVFDGPMAYIGDSGPEKTLTAGEPLDIELKYENTPFTVQTTALFIEALNKEPKSRDKSAALQARIVRYYFPNRYAKDLNFEHTMTAPRMLDALLTLLWEHWVTETEIDSKLAVTDESFDLQTEHDMDRSPILAYIEETSRNNMNLLADLQSGGYRADALVDALHPWMSTQGYGERTATAIWEQLSEHFKIERKTFREPGRGPVTRRIITEVYPNTLRALKAMEGANNAEDEAVVRED